MNKPVLAEETKAASPLAREVERRRTFAIISHPDAGKTTLTEKLLLFGGAINLAGQVKAKRDRRSTRSDWMSIERERGISVVTSVMTFEYEGKVYNLLDTPGHEDFSEDTYRTLTAVDSAVMVIDAAKGIEARTRKLFEVCRLRDIPIITFINKMDRESRDPFDLLDEIEKTLALDTAPVTWPIGRGRDFLGTLNLADGGVRLIEGDAAKTGVATRMSVAEMAKLNPNLDSKALEDEFALVRDACHKFDLASLPRRASDAGVLRQRAEEFRRRRSARGTGHFRAAAARAAIGSAPRRCGRAADDRLRVQDPGQYGSQSSRPYCLRAHLLGKIAARHEGAAVAHRQADAAVDAAFLLRQGSRDRGRGLCRRRGRHPEPRHACASATR